jgi:hypothetical protein
MQTRQIPKSEWPAFLDRFSRQHGGSLVKLEILGSEIGAQVSESGLALEGLTDEWDEMNGSTIIITAGNTPDHHITHSINLPKEISLEQTDEGADVALSIKANDATTALLTFCDAVAPETGEVPAA